MSASAGVTAPAPLTSRVVRFFGHGGGVAFALIGAILAVAAGSAWLFALWVRHRLQRDVARLLGDAGTLAASSGGGAGGGDSFSLTKTASPCTSTRQREIGSNAGARSASPVRRLKQA